MIKINEELHMALKITKDTPIHLSYCRACSLFRNPVCKLLKCENIRFERTD